MGTRAVITFEDDVGKYSVYQHWDGNPATVLENLQKTEHRWTLPRFEADEFAAAYIATHKTSSGNIRMTKGPRAHGDLAYVYTVTHSPGSMALTVTYKGTYRGAVKETRNLFPEEKE